MYNIPDTGLTATHKIGDQQVVISLFPSGDEKYAAVIKCAVSKVNTKGSVVTENIGLTALSGKTAKGISEYFEMWVKQEGYPQFAGYIYKKVLELWGKATS